MRENTDQNNFEYGHFLRSDSGNLSIQDFTVETEKSSASLVIP